MTRGVNCVGLIYRIEPRGGGSSLAALSYALSYAVSSRARDNI